MATHRFQIRGPQSEAVLRKVWMAQTLPRVGTSWEWDGVIALVVLESENVRLRGQRSEASFLQVQRASEPRYRAGPLDKGRGSGYSIWAARSREQMGRNVRPSFRESSKKGPDHFCTCSGLVNFREGMHDPWARCTVWLQS